MWHGEGGGWVGGGAQTGVDTDLCGLAGAVMIGLMDDVVDDHLGNFPRHLLLGLKDTGKYTKLKNTNNTQLWAL